MGKRLRVSSACLLDCFEEWPACGEVRGLEWLHYLAWVGKLWIALGGR